MHLRSSRGAVSGLAVLTLAGSLLAGITPAVTAAPPTSELSSGETWSVDRAPGGYLVTVELDEPLEMRSDAPTVVVDGTDVGIATESADGRSLSVFTTDPGVVDADEVRAGWSSEASGPGLASASVVEVPELVSAEAIDADPLALGDYEWTESLYNFGHQAVPLAAIGGVRGELEGRIYLPTTGGARPTVILLHGRHTSCYGTGPSNPDRWPCEVAPGDGRRKTIPSYLGYDGTARILASYGYAVVSISANAVNSNDNQLAADQGAQARGQLILDTIEMLDDASAGRPVSYYDAWMDRQVTLDQALAQGAADYPLRAEGFTYDIGANDTITAATLAGRFDLNRIGLMGHSRGGEGVTSAATLNQALDAPWGILSILPLAPVDFGRMTVPDVPMQVMLPYCDGDVSNQQGQHMLDDTRYAFDDDVLRSGVWVMGANHNFYNTSWTPGLYLYSVSDDWSGTSPTSARALEPICGTAPATAETSIRLSPQEQYDQGSAYMSSWFRLTMGGEEQFLPLFDGSGAVPEVLGDADVRSVATAPAGSRATVVTFETTSPLVRTFGTATATPCASLSGRTIPQDLAPCASTIASAQAPHWTPASNGGNVPATPVTRMQWTSTTGEVRVSIPTGQRDATPFERIAVKMAASESVDVGTDLTVTVVDGAGRTWSRPVSVLNPLALVRLPTSTSSAATSTLKKVVLQQVNVAVPELAEAGLAVGDLREVRFTAAGGADGATGGAYLSDLAFESSAVGTPQVRTQPVIDVYAPNNLEGDAPNAVEFAAYLDAPAPVPVTGYVSLLGSTTGRAGIAMEKVTFAPGEVCKPVTVPLQGDTAPSSSVSTSVKASVINTSGAVMGKNSIVFTTIAEDDGILGTATTVAPPPLPSFGAPGPACAEVAALLDGGTVEGAEVMAPGSEAIVAATGFRSGEAVTFAAPGVASVLVEANGAGRAVALLTVPADLERGTLPLTATSAGTGRVATGTTRVLDASVTTLALSPAAPALREPVTLTAGVAGGVATGEVQFLDGTDVIATAEAVDGTATVVVPGLGAGEHTLTARFVGNEVTQGSVSAPVSLTLARRQPTVVLALSEAQSVFGSPATVSVTVAGAGGGDVELGVGTTVLTVPVDAEGRASHRLPATLSAGGYVLTAQYLGSEDAERSTTARAAYRVVPKATTTTVRAPARTRRGARFAVRLQVGGAVVGAPSGGTVRVRVKGGGRTVTRTVPVSAAGTATLRLRAPARGKRLRVAAQYRPGANYAPSTATRQVVRLR